MLKAGISLEAVSGELIEGTITGRLLERNASGRIEARREQAGSVPAVEEFARTVVEAAVDPRLMSGATIFVGATDF